MKTAIIEPVGGHGGMNYYDLSLANALCSNGVSPIFYTCDKTKIPDSATFLIKRTFIEIWGTKPKSYRAVRFLVGLCTSLFHAKKKHVKITHFHFFHYTILEKLCVNLAKFLGFKIIITVHDVESFSDKQNTSSIRKILIKADRLISHNNISKKELVEKIKLPERLIKIIPHGNYVNNIPQALPQSKAKKILELPHDSPVILFFGQIKKVKGLDLLLNAMPAVIESFPKAVLVLAGKVWKNDFSIYENIIYKNHIEKNVVCHIRYVSDEEVPIFYNAADIVALPYTRIYQSGVLLMAMSYEKPVLVSDLEGMTEIIKDNENGFVFKTGDTNDLSQTLLYALRDTERLKQITSNGFNTVISKHDWDSIGRKTAGLYWEVIL